jgi:hypothetical protein
MSIPTLPEILWGGSSNQDVLRLSWQEQLKVGSYTLCIQGTLLVIQPYTSHTSTQPWQEKQGKVQPEKCPFGSKLFGLQRENDSVPNPSPPGKMQNKPGDFVFSLSTYIEGEQYISIAICICICIYIFSIYIQFYIEI